MARSKTSSAKSKRKPQLGIGAFEQEQFEERKQQDGGNKSDKQDKQDKQSDEPGLLARAVAKVASVFRSNKKPAPKAPAKKRAPEKKASAATRARKPARKPAKRATKSARR